MMETILFFSHYAFILLFGVILSFSFCGLRFVKKTVIYALLTFAFCGILQIVVFYLLGEANTWKLYPIIVHLPLGVLLCALFKKRVITVLAAISLSYLCCQPSKWIGLLLEAVTQNNVIVFSAKILVALSVALVFIRFLSSYISEIFNKDSRSVLIFSFVPLIYYLFDYTVSIYTNLWDTHYRIVAEFLAFFLCMIFVAFCVIYYKEYEKKVDAERKEQIVEITLQQQAREIEAIKKSNLETRLLRHDMRLLLANLALTIKQGDKETSLKMISGFTKEVEANSLYRYCENDTVNYIIANFENKCRQSAVHFDATVDIEKLSVDEVLFSSIISNALDNALNAQTVLPEEERQIKLMLKDSDGKLLLSVKNPFKVKPVFVDGIPISDKKGHGYGTQSIRYLTEKLGGKCQFTLQNNTFILRIVL